MARKEKAKGECCICGKETELYCGSCCETWGEFTPTFYCDEHYTKVVLTGNCCRGNEQLYDPE